MSSASMQIIVLSLGKWHVDTIEERAHKLGITRSEYTRRWLDQSHPPDADRD